MRTRRAKAGTRTAERGERERIIADARRRFFAHGFRNVTMADLATDLGMSKKTLYVHFADKSALLAAMIDDKLAHIQADLGGIMDARDMAFSDRLQRLLAAQRGHMAEIQPAFVRDVRREKPELFAHIQQGRRKVIHRCFGNLLKAGRKTGAIRTDIPVKVLIEILVSTVDAVLVPERVEELGMTPRTAFSQLITVFLEGVLVREGRAK